MPTNHVQTAAVNIHEPITDLSSISCQKHSEGDLLAEAVIVGGIPYFAVSRSNFKDITLKSFISIDDKSEYKPYGRTMYLNEPYRFKSKQDFEAFIQKAIDETLDSLYRKIKAIWLKYIDADDFHISICAADTVFTYYQDRVDLTHYLFFIGVMIVGVGVCMLS